MTKNNNLLFADFHKDKAFNGILAIEPELGQDYFFEHSIKGEEKPGRSNRSSKLKEKYKFKYKYKGNDRVGLRGHSESDMIWEVDSLHEVPLKKRNELIQEFTDDYKGQFTLGRSRKASGGVHFHVFSKLNKSISLPVFQSIDILNIRENLYSTLLFGIIDDNKFYSRAVYAHRNFDKNELIPQGNRNHIACTKMDFLPGIEYRANNVFDIRLYGYYAAITLMGISKVELPSPIKKDSIRKSLDKGNQEEKPQKDADEFGRLHASKLKPLIDMGAKTTFSMPILKQNLGKMLFVLSINELPDARTALEEYIKEILGLDIEAIPFDFSTGKITKARAGYVMDIGGVATFFREKKSIRKILTDFGTGLFATALEGSLSSVTSSLKKANLINK